MFQKPFVSFMLPSLHCQNVEYITKGLRLNRTITYTCTTKRRRKAKCAKVTHCYTLLHCPLYTRNYCSCTSKQTCSCSHSVYEPVNTLPGKCNRLIFVHKPPFTLKHNFTQTNSKGSQTNLHKQLMKNGLTISVYSYAGNVVYFTN